MRLASWSGYFRDPFPSARGHSPYRFPGLLVHVPVWLAFLVLGYQLNGQQAWLYPAVVGYCIIGLYLGRDLAVLAHYNLYIVLLVLAVLLSYKPWIAPMFGALQQDASFVYIAIAADVICFAGFAGYVIRRRAYFTGSD
jgi:hypothetical protein